MKKIIIIIFSILLFSCEKNEDIEKEKNNQIEETQNNFINTKWMKKEGKHIIPFEEYDIYTRISIGIEKISTSYGYYKENNFISLNTHTLWFNYYYFIKNDTIYTYEDPTKKEKNTKWIIKNDSLMNIESNNTYFKVNEFTNPK